MAIQLLKHSVFLALVMALVGCEKWADGVVRDIDFPEHTPELAATVNLFAGDTKAIAALHQSASTLDANDAVIPEGLTARIEKEGDVLLLWTPSDTALVGTSWDSRTMHVLDLSAPLALPEGELDLIVEAPGFEPLTATAVQPPAPICSVGFEEGADTTSDFGEPVVLDRFELDILNRPGIRDVYGIQLHEGYVNNPGDTLWQLVGIGDGDSDLEPRTTFNQACFCLLLDDQGLDAQSLEDVFIDRKRWISGYGESGGGDVLRMKVVLMDAPLAQFYRSLDTHWETQDSFFANPSTIFSNTSTGYGIFGLGSSVEFFWE